MDDPPRRRDRTENTTHGQEGLSPVVAEQVVPGGRAGRVEGRRTPFRVHDPRTPVAHADGDACGVEAVGQEGAGTVQRRRDLEGRWKRHEWPGRVVPPATLHLVLNGRATT